MLSGEKPNVRENLFTHLLQSVIPLEHVAGLPVESNPDLVVVGISCISVELDLNEDWVSLFLGSSFSIRDGDANSPIFTFFFN